MDLYYDERFLEHTQGAGPHPERPERLRAIVEKLKAEGLWEQVRAPRPATGEELRRVHNRTYLGVMEQFTGQWDPDTWVGPDTWAIARLAAGASIDSALLAWRERRPAFALVRPPGHHATPSTAMGFCYLNNIALAAEALRTEPGCERVAIVDFDVHHGNGTQDAFYNRDDVLFISLHQIPYYPGSGSDRETGHGPGEGYTVNLPMPVGAGDASYALAFDRVVIPVLDHFAPQALLISVGADGHFADRMGGIELSTCGFLAMTEKLITLSERHCPGRVACMLEGGYHLDSLAETVAAIIARFRNKTIELKYTDNAEPAPIAERAIENVRNIVSDYFDLPD